jgi:hypothetical protein
MERKKPTFERDSGPAENQQNGPDVIISKLINDTFRPTEAQKRAKAALMAALSDPMNSLLDPKTISMTLAMRLTGIQTLNTWWHQPGFQNWFLNKEETKQKIKYLTDKALETAVQILDDPDPRTANAKVAILRTLMQYEAAEVQTKTNTRFDSMDMQQLRGFLKQNAHIIRPLLEEAKSATVTSESEDNSDENNNGD